MQAEALTGLIRALQLGPTVIAGGSGGARVSMLAAARDREICSHLAIWWISGDPIGLMQLATYYCGEAATLASQGGMEAVLVHLLGRELQPQFAVEGSDPPDGPGQIHRHHAKWAAAYAPSDISPCPA